MKRRRWRTARLIFRGVRIFILLLVLAAVVAAIWLSQVGVPEFLKQRIVAELRARGMDVQFRQMRLVWYRGIVAEDVQFGRADQPIGPRVSAIQAELRLDARALLHRRLELEGVVLHGGRVTLPIWGATRERTVAREFVVEKIGGELKFHPGDEWELSNLQAQAFGVKLRMQGAITNASMIRNWKFWREQPLAKTPQAFWSELLADFEKTKFEVPSEILATVTGDARDLQTFRASVNIASPAIDSPWGKGKEVALSAQIAPEPGHLLFADVKLQANDPRTRWGDAKMLKLAAQLAPSLTHWTPTNAHVELELKGATTRWGKASTVALKTDFRPNAGVPGSSRAEYEFRAQQVDSSWGRFARAQMNGIAIVNSSNLWPNIITAALNFSGGELKWGRAASGTVESRLDLPALEAMEFSNTNASWWTRADKVRADIKATFADVHTPKLDVKSLAIVGDWQFPNLNVRQLEASVYDGELHGTVHLDAATRQLAATTRTTFDPKRAASLLSTNASAWLSHYSWEQPPKLSASAKLVLPAWTNQNRTWQQVDWRDEVAPTLKVDGTFQVGAASYREVSVLSAQSDVTFSNFIWRLPNLKAARPEGNAVLSLVSDERSSEFQLSIDSRIDPKALLPWLTKTEREVFGEFEFTQPPHIRAEAAGKWHEPAQTTLRSELRMTNVSFRAQPVLACDTTVTFTNRILTFEQPHVVRAEGSAAATQVRIDFEREKLFIHNATGSLDIAALTLAISTNVARIMEPYHFIAPPVGWADGVLDLKNDEGTDLRFRGRAGPFQWEAFRFQQITGEVHWLGNTLTLSNVQGSLLGGRVEGSAWFNFDGKDRGTDFAFRTLFNGIDLQSLTREVRGRTNHVEGTMAGLLVVTNASTENLQSWQGYGNVAVQEGLLWDFPVFGVFSPLLNAIKPGSGNSRAKDATATFGITNSIIYSTDLQIHASGMRLLYDGTVNFDSQVNGRMEAQLFRDTPALGGIVSKVLWPVTKLFEYRVGGTLAKPTAQPLYIPKIFLMPFHPLRTLRELMGGDDSSPLPGKTPGPAE